MLGTGEVDMGLDNGDEHAHDDAARFFPSGDRLVVRNSDNQKVAEAFRNGEIVIRPTSSA